MLFFARKARDKEKRTILIERKRMHKLRIRALLLKDQERSVHIILVCEF